MIIPLRDRLPSLPDRHRQALAVAAGDAEGPALDRFLVGLGMLGPLSAASAQPRVVDDAHLLDAESLEAPGFVARRIEAEAIAILFAGRVEEGLAGRLVGVPGLTLLGLPLDSAVRLLRRSLAEPVDLRGTALLIGAADGFHGHDPAREQRTLLTAFESCMSADRMMRGVTLVPAAGSSCTISPNLSPAHGPIWAPAGGSSGGGVPKP